MIIETKRKTTFSFMDEDDDKINIEYDSDSEYFEINTNAICLILRLDSLDNLIDVLEAVRELAQEETQHDE